MPRPPCAAGLAADDLFRQMLRAQGAALLRHQVRHADPLLDGGLLCPACARIHGRSYDAAYPLAAMAALDGDARYLEAAVRAMRWGDRMRQADGSCRNDLGVGGGWTGISVFAALILHDLIAFHRDRFDRATIAGWEKRLRATAGFVMDTFTIDTGNINYPATAAAVGMLAARLLGERCFEAPARALAEQCAAKLCGGLLVGEGRPASLASARGVQPVDIAYNVSESLPALVRYAEAAGDEGMRRLLIGALQAHAAFMLPDGGVDDSFCTRSYKWTYWGSRTSDGAQVAYAMLADEDPLFAAIAGANTSLVASCTVEGLVYGGPHLRTCGAPPCIHHTICQARSLAFLVDTGRHCPPPRPWPAREDRVRWFAHLATCVVEVGDWRATITANDWYYQGSQHPSGGSLSLLHHRRSGPVMASSLLEYLPVEPNNMQAHPGPTEAAVMGLETACGRLRSAHCRTARVVVDGTVVRVETALAARPDAVDPMASMSAWLEYVFSGEELVISAGTDADGAILALPLICASDEDLLVADREVSIANAQGRMQLRVEQGGLSAGRPFLNLVPGFRHVVVRIRMANGRASLRLRWTAG